MHISYKGHNPTSHGLSSKGIIEYLSKEDLDLENALYFNNERNDISFQEAIDNIDDNKGSHSNSQSKFYMLNISPSQKELSYLDEQCERYLDLTNFSKDEHIREVEKDRLMKNMLQNYTNEMMQKYAENFNKDLKIDDLVYVAKVEKERTYKANDKHVLENLKREKDGLEPRLNSKGEKIQAGQKKEGLNYHIHVVVSRYEKEGNQREKRSFSPMSKGKESKGLNDSKIGFNRDNLNQESETKFDEYFHYKREINEKYETLKHDKNTPRQSHEQQESLTSKGGNLLADYYVNLFKDGLKEGKAIDSSIPLSPTELKLKMQFQIKEHLGLNELKTPTQMIKKELKTILDLTDKGIDI